MCKQETSHNEKLWGVCAIHLYPARPIEVDYIVRNPALMEKLNLKYFGDVSSKDISSVRVTDFMLEDYKQTINLVKTRVFGSNIGKIKRNLEEFVTFEIKSRLQFFREDHFALLREPLV